MPKPAPFPIQVGELTAEFLSDALGGVVKNFRAKRIGADRGMLGEIFLLELETLDPAVPQQLVAKFAALREGSLASAKRGRNHERELRCYEEYLTQTGVRTPELFGAWYEEASAHFLLLQGAVDADTSVDQVAGLTLAQAELVVDEMAALHAQWWGDAGIAEQDWLPPLDAPQRVENLTALAKMGWAPLMDMVGDQMPHLPTGFGDALPDRIAAALTSLARLPHTLLHSDLRADNLLFDASGREVSIIDWQGCGTGPGVFDLAYFVVQSLTIEDRRQHQAALLQRWVDQLRTRGVVAEDPTVGFAEAPWYSLAVACAIPVISDPGEARAADLARAMATRTLAALADAGQLI